MASRTPETGQPVLVVGAGITGVSCAQQLRARGVPVRVVNKGKRIGGRMASRIVRDSGTRFDGRIFDIGASYFTANDPIFAGVVSELVATGVAHRWTDSFHFADSSGIQGIRVGPMRYRAAQGIRSVVEHLAVGLDIEEGELGQLGEFGDSAQLSERIALCMPTPQAVKIYPAAQDFSPTTWEPVIAVSLLFESSHWEPFDGVFVNDDSAVTWIANDGSRRGDDAPALVAHVHPVLSSHHLADPASVITHAIKAVQRVLGFGQEPLWASAHRWTYAKPVEGTTPQGSTRVPFVHGERVSLAGDEFSQRPRVEAAWISGHALANSLAASNK